MSRGPDDIIREYLQREGSTRGNAELAAEEILDALEAEGFLTVPREAVRTISETIAAMRGTEP